MILISSAIFFVGIFIGYFSAHALEDLAEGVESLFSPLTSLPLLMLAMIILANNLIKTFIYMILGVLFAIPPTLFALVNGIILGVVSFFVAEEKGVLFLLAGLLPHGVFEIPALLLSCALGIEIGICMIKKVRGREVNIGGVVKSSIKVYFMIVAPLLLLAALIEVYVTSLLLQQLLLSS